jgi:hypothetical protein
MAASANRVTVIHQLANSLSPSDLEELRVQRLRELRAAIQSLRGEPEDPLLAWAIDQDHQDPANPAAKR